MTVLHLEPLAGIALPFSILMLFARMVRQRAGNCGWGDTIWTVSAQMPRSRGARSRDHQSRTSAFFPLPPHEGVGA